ncbi:2-C-methyl-D-erythritol 4-phosphate cytidylyltransferase [Erysipelothrix urinaevulpis]|uniref:IspD/TarI family cytidylyltransferase n=1 Tax=Erysipelothrix urinaevulpis TaxID=2683717 RepID=UPI00135B1849|nr:2-C-methyl-D-erythritol 4-phosphate cytidylyltransferase [Erysipelothrix urinaevulpis]
MDYSVLIVAAGNAAAEGKSYKRAFASFNEKKSVLGQTVSVFLKDDRCKQVVIVASSADLSRVVRSHDSGKIVYVKGASTRMESVLIGLTAVSEDVVLIHDGVRPWIRKDYIDRLLGRMGEEKACVLAIRPKGTLRRVENGYISEKIKTNDIVVLQTPQAFNTSFIIQCYAKAIDAGHNLLDDSDVVTAVSDVKIAVEEGDLRNTRFLLKNKEK